jgi:hypothetical protein
MTFLKSVKRFIMDIIEAWQEARNMQAKEYTKWHS